MSGSALSLGVDGGKSHAETGGMPHLSPLRKAPHLHNESKNKSTLRMSEKTWESRRIKEEIQDILSPTPLELHKVGSYPKHQQKHNTFYLLQILFIFPAYVFVWGIKISSL